MLTDAGTRMRTGPASVITRSTGRGRQHAHRVQPAFAHRIGDSLLVRAAPPPNLRGSQGPQRCSALRLTARAQRVLPRWARASAFCASASARFASASAARAKPSFAFASRSARSACTRRAATSYGSEFTSDSCRCASATARSAAACFRAAAASSRAAAACRRCASAVQLARSAACTYSRRSVGSTTTFISATRGAPRRRQRPSEQRGPPGLLVCPWQGEHRIVPHEPACSEE